MRYTYALAALACALLIAGCGDQFRTETKVDNEGTITRTITFFFAVEAETLDEAKAALNLDRFTLPPGGKWEKVSPETFGDFGEMEIPPPGGLPAPAPQEGDIPEDTEIEVTPGGGMMSPTGEGWQYVVTKTYKPGERMSDFGYSFPGSKDVGAFSMKNGFQVEMKKRDDGSTEYVFTENVEGTDLDKVMVAVFSGALVQPILDELGDDATPELAKDLKATISMESLEMLGAGGGPPPSGSAVKEIFRKLFADTLTEHIGADKADAVLTRIARRALRPNYMLALMGDVLKATAKIDDVAFLQVSDEVTMPGVIESVEGGMQMDDSMVMWSFSPMGGEGETGEVAPSAPKPLKIVSVAK